MDRETKSDVRRSTLENDINMIFGTAFIFDRIRLE